MGCDGHASHATYTIRKVRGHAWLEEFACIHTCRLREKHAKRPADLSRLLSGIPEPARAAGMPLGGAACPRWCIRRAVRLHCGACALQPMNRQAAHFSLAAFNMTRYKRGASRGLAAPDGAEDSDVFVIRNVDAVAVDEVEP